jgi:hypothetical protein
MATLVTEAADLYLDAKIFGQSGARHTHKQRLAFLKKLDRETPGNVTLHLALDNYAIH